MKELWITPFLTYLTSILRGLALSSSIHTLAQRPLDTSSEVASTFATLPIRGRILHKMASFQSSIGSRTDNITIRRLSLTEPKFHNHLCTLYIWLQTNQGSPSSTLV